MLLGEKIDLSNYPVDMVDGVKGYVEYVNDFLPHEAYTETPVKLQVEAKTDFSSVIPDGFGTVDAYFVDENTKEVHIFDFKYGRIMVEVEDNPQLLLYALGIYLSVQDSTTYKYIIHVCQPRANNFESATYTPSDMLRFMSSVQDAYREYKKGGQFRPSDKACQWCDYKGRCGALKRSLTKTFKLSDNFEIGEKELSKDDILGIIASEKLMKLFIESVKERAVDILKSGESLEGLKLVRSVTRRVWSNEQEAETALFSELGEEAYSKKLIGITDAQRKIGKKVFEAEYGELIEKPVGQLQAALISDRRKEVDLSEETELELKDFE
jgi:hypothetical protein